LRRKLISWLLQEALVLTPRRVLILASALMLTAVGDIVFAADPPRISKPKPAPPDLAPDVPPLPPATFDNTLAIGGQDVKARALDTRLSVDVHVNGRGPYRFVVDSGADTSAVGLRIAHDLELPLGEPAVLNGMTSRDVVDRVKVAKLTLGPTTVANLEVPALREIDLGGDGLVGIDALVQQRLMMDFEKRLIKVEDARVPIKIEPGEIVIIAHKKRGQLILTEVRAARQHLDAVIDTGSEITIGNLALRDKLVAKNRAKFYEVEAIGVTGVHVKMQIARIDELQLGPVTLRDVPIAFADVPPFKLFGLADEPALLLGTDILETFRRVSLDFRARRVRFQLRTCQTDGVALNTAPTDMFTRISATTMEACRR
jgi:Aspartyl protease